MRWMALAVLLIVVMSAYVAYSQPDLYFVIYGESACSHCSAAKSYLARAFGSERVEFRELAENETYVTQYFQLYNLLPLGECCYVPLIVVYVGGEPRMAVLGFEENKDFWVVHAEDAVDNDVFLAIVVKKGGEKVTQLNSSYIRIVNGIVGRLAILSSQEGISKPNVQGEKSKPEVNGTANELTPPPPKLTLKEVLPALIGAALADSVNPCTFSVFTALLLIVATIKGLRRAGLSGIAFISAIYVAYFVLGLGLVKVFSYMSFLKYLIVILGLTLGTSALIGGISGYRKGVFKSPLPGAFKKVTENLIEKAINPLTAAAAGLIISFTLLPCSSGPYLITAMLLSRMEPQMLVPLLLALYNIIFVAPLIIILAATLFLSLRLRKIKEWRSKGLPLMEAISGLLLIGISIYALLTLP